MSRTLLIGDSAGSWKDWLKTHLQGRDLICLDPEDALQSPPGRLTLHRGDKVAAWAFYGSLDAVRAPHSLIAGLFHLLGSTSEDAVVILPSYRPTPLFRQLATTIAEIVRPHEAFVGGQAVHLRTLAPETIEIDLNPGFDEDIRHAQRKAHWLKLIEACVPHEVLFDKVEVEGARLGSGIPFDRPLGVALYAETCGATLLLISNDPLDDEAISKALDTAHCGRAVAVRSDAYDGLLCAFSKQNGECFGMGLIQSVDFERRVFHVLCNAIPPAPVRILRIGGLKLSLDGDELGEIRPWQV